MTLDKGTILKKMTLANGTVLTLYDRSKKIAGDRWYVRVDGDLAFPVDVTAECVRQLAPAAEDFGDYVLARAGEPMSLSFSRERNFIAEELKQEVVEEIIGCIETSLLGYFEGKSVTEKMVARKIGAWHREYQLARQQEAQDPDDEEEGPADFSSCFRDDI